MDKIEMRVQVQLNRTEVAHAGEARNSHQRINRSKNQSESSWAINALPQPRPKSDQTAHEVKNVMSGRKREIEHFMSKESHDTNYDQDRSAQHYIDFCQRVSHFRPPFHWGFFSSRNRVELMARVD